MSVKGALNFGLASKTERSKSLISKTTQPHVGPGSYELSRSLNLRNQNPSFSRAIFAQTVQRPVKNKGSIRGNYEEDSETGDKDEAYIDPGPG